MNGVLIVAGEVAFRAFVLGGLAARYLLRRPSLGAVLLLMTPVVDLALIAARAALWMLMLAIDFIWSFNYTLRPRKAKAS